MPVIVAGIIGVTILGGLFLSKDVIDSTGNAAKNVGLKQIAALSIVGLALFAIARKG